MNNPQFTSGPWHVSENQPTVVGNKEKAVCKCEIDWDLGAKERKANAALIAAAPEMYAMLEQLVEAVKTLNAISLIKIKDKLIEDAVNIIKKARGEE